MMKRLKICCFLGLALLLLTLPVRGAELPPEVERALPREAGQLLKDVDHWDVNSFPEGLCAIWNHLRKDVNTVLRRQTRGAVSVLLVAVLCGLVSGFQKGVGDESRFLPMAGGLAVTALTAGPGSAARRFPRSGLPRGSWRFQGSSPAALWPAQSSG